MKTRGRPHHLTPSCGGHAPTAERTLNRQGRFWRVLTTGPELENSQGHYWKQKAYVSMASRGPCDPRLVRDHAGYFASCAARYASASFFSSSAVSFGGSTEIVTLLILPVNVNGI
jgi:hypothetical protein